MEPIETLDTHKPPSSYAQRHPAILPQGQRNNSLQPIGRLLQHSLRGAALLHPFSLTISSQAKLSKSDLAWHRHQSSGLAPSRAQTAARQRPPKFKTAPSAVRPQATISLRLPPTHNSHHSSANLACAAIAFVLPGPELTCSAYRVTRGRQANHGLSLLRIGEDGFARLISSYIILFISPTPALRLQSCASTTSAKPRDNGFLHFHTPGQLFRGVQSLIIVSASRRPSQLLFTWWSSRACPSWFHQSSAYSGISSSPLSHPLSPRSPISTSLQFIVSHTVVVIISRGGKKNI